MVIQHNTPALYANCQSGIISGQIASSARKLSSGYRINRSADNAAGLSISEKMRKQLRGLDMGAENIEDGISYVQVADGALNEVHEILQRINELAVQSANGTNSETDREHINDEVQELKSEMQRIFVTTTFNEKKIWQENIVSVPNIINTKQVQAVKVSTPSSQSLTINNDSYGLIAACTPYTSSSIDYHTFDDHSSTYRINADAKGVNISWTAYNGTKYQTKTATWKELRAKNFEFNIGDYFVNKDADGNAITDPDKQLLDAAGNPKFDFKIALNCISTASNEEIAKAINNTTMSQSVSSSTKFQDEGSTLNSSGLTLVSTSFVYAAAYADAAMAKANGTTGYDFENPKDIFIEPVGTTTNLTNNPCAGASLATARSSTGKWTFAFTSAGLGNLTATSSEVVYYSTDARVTPSPKITPYNSTTTWTGDDVDDKNIFWEEKYYSRDYDNTTHSYTKKEWYAATKHIPAGSGTLGDVMGTLTGRSGLLSKNIKNGTTGNKGGTDTGGYVYITFDVTSDTPYSYGNTTSNKVGTFALRFSVGTSDTEQSILTKLQKAFNGNTLFDLNFTTKNSASVTRSGYYTSLTDVHEYEYEDHLQKNELVVHSGADAKDEISFKYDCLRLKYIGMHGTNVLTEDSSLRTLDEVSSALKIISAQRSMFGSYQNRLEHAYSINKNTSENTQAAESQIRDTDMAEEMVRYSNLNILGQAANSMLAQANQTHQNILSLLQ